MTSQHEIDSAFFKGFREGFDPEVAEDLGIPMTPESVERHIESAKIVAAAGEIALEAEIEDPRQEWIDSFHLSQPSSEGPIRFATPEERAETTRQANRIRNLVHPTNHEQ